MIKRLNAGVLLILFATVGCGKDQAEATTKTYLDAIQYRDVDGVYSQHTESTGQATYCASMPFHRVLDRVRKSKPDKKRCAQAKAVTTALGDPKMSTNEETQMFFQVVRFVCEQPRGTCRDYGKLVFRQQLTQSALWKTPVTGYRIEKIERRDGVAVVYLDVQLDAPKRTRHHIVHLRQIESRWVVTDAISTWDAVIR